MKITALTNNLPVNELLANYTLSLFEQTKIEVIDNTKLSAHEIRDKIEASSLLIFLMDEENSLVKSIISNKLILLMSTFKDGLEGDTIETINSTITDLKKSGNTILGTFRLLDTTKAFNSELEIETIGKRLELIRMVNSIMYHDLGIRNNNYFSCGIAPPKYYVGDSIGY